MKQPLMFWKLLRDWTAMPKVLDNCIARGDAGREPQAGWVPLKGLSAILTCCHLKRTHILAVLKLTTRYPTIPLAAGVQCILVGNQQSRTGSTARNLRNANGSDNAPA